MIKLTVFLLLVANISFATVTKSFDTDNKCTLYRVPTEASPLEDNEVVILDKDAYGLTIVDLDIDFKNQSVSVQPMINVVLGFNRPLINTRATISNKNPNFKFLINQLNRKLYVFEKMCINSKNEIIYAKQFETETK